MTTYEEAKRCPKCETPGEETSRNPTKKPGVFSAMIFCRNEVCRWFNTPWVVQINADGSVPPPQDPRAQPKLYPDLGAGKHMTEQVNKNLEQQLSAEQGRGGVELNGK